MNGSRSIIATAVALGLLAGTAVWVTAQEEDVAANPDPLGDAWVTGTVSGGTGGQVESSEVTGQEGLTPSRFHWQDMRIVMSDPRLSGVISAIYDQDVHTGVAGDLSTFTVGSGTYRIENEAGSWEGPNLFLNGGSSGTATVSDTGIIVGSGAYEGLSAFLVFDFTQVPASVVGAIFPGEVPPQVTFEESPEEAVAEAPAAFSELRVADVAERTRDLTIESPSVGEVKVRLLLPASFADDPEVTYPVLYLLHGATQDYTAWTAETDVEELTADLPLLVVMPEAGEWGWYSDWWNDGEGGPPAWETFHLEEVRDIIERDWRASDERVIAGLSMGGYGALHYATAHPELFKAAASFSGVVDPNGVGRGLSIDPLAWGDPDEQAEVWAAHDPVGMAEALRGTPVYLSWGNGQPGPLDPSGTTADSYGLEAWVAPQNEALAARLEELGIPATVETGPGAHEWPYWEQGLHRALPMLLEAVDD
jgi:S-formylglutathione hydrolase FrmB